MKLVIATYGTEGDTRPLAALGRALIDAGHEVRTSSDRVNPLHRAAEHAGDLVRWRRQLDAVVVSVFSGRAFALGDESLTLARALGRRLGRAVRRLLVGPGHGLAQDRELLEVRSGRRPGGSAGLQITRRAPPGRQRAPGSAPLAPVAFSSVPVTQVGP